MAEEGLEPSTGADALCVPDRSYPSSSACRVIAMLAAKFSLAVPPVPIGARSKVETGKGIGVFTLAGGPEPSPLQPGMLRAARFCGDRPCQRDPRGRHRAQRAPRHGR